MAHAIHILESGNGCDFILEKWHPCDLYPFIIACHRYFKTIALQVFQM